MAEFIEFHPVVVTMYLDEAKKLLVTANTENKIEVSLKCQILFNDLLTTCRYGISSHYSLLRKIIKNGLCIFLIYKSKKDFVYIQLLTLRVKLSMKHGVAA